MLSIVIVTYNQENYIERLLESIIAQKCKYKYEILVGDDASKDSTAEVILRIAKENPQLNIVPILRKSNMGATKNCVDLMEKAKGKYIVCCDGDDCWYGIDRIDEQVEFLESHPEYSAHCGKVYLIDENDNILPDDTVPKSKQFWKFDKGMYTLQDFEEWKMPCQYTALMFRSKLLDSDVNKEVLLAHPMVIDKSIMLSLLSLGNIYCCSKYIGCYRIYNSSNHYMQQYEEKNLRDLDYDYTKKLELYVQNVFKPEFSLSMKLKHIFVSSICAWLKNRNYRNWQVIRKIYNKSDERYNYSKLFFKTIILKLYYWHIKKRDIFINLE